MNAKLAPLQTPQAVAHVVDAVEAQGYRAAFVALKTCAWRSGNRVRVQSHAFICDLVTIGDDCFISHGAMFVNDPFATGRPARGARVNTPGRQRRPGSAPHGPT